MKKIILAIITPLVTNVALGGMTIDYYKEISKDEELKHIATAYVTGLGEGFFWSNAALKANNKNILYCPPPKLKINGDVYMDILNQQINDGKYAKDTELGLVLFSGLRKTFPCS